MIQKAQQKEKLLTDLEELRNYAEGRGANNAVIIPGKEVLVDPRVRFKCMIPKCFSSGKCSHCPPHGFSFDEVKKAVSSYDFGVFFRVKVKNTIIAAESLSDGLNQGIFDDKGNIFNLGAHYILVFTIVKLLQKKAGEMGYISTRGFAAGNCRDALCNFQPTCQDLMTKRGCRHGELSSPSMESCGMDIFTMAARVGWDVYPIGGSRVPEDVPHGTLMGLVMIA